MISKTKLKPSARDASSTLRPTQTRKKSQRRRPSILFASFSFLERRLLATDAVQYTATSAAARKVMLPAIKITKFQFVIFALQKKWKSES
jgi:hypothetical protein